MSRAACRLTALRRLCFSDNSPFTCCIVDEAGQCIEPEAFIPLEYGFTKLVLVGDHNQHNQLPPTVKSQVSDRPSAAW